MYEVTKRNLKVFGSFYINIKTNLCLITIYLLKAFINFHFIGIFFQCNKKIISYKFL